MFWFLLKSGDMIYGEIVIFYCLNYIYNVKIN